jgi:hypothetical protein
MILNIQGLRGELKKKGNDCKSDHQAVGKTGSMRMIAGNR